MKHPLEDQPGAAGPIDIVYLWVDGADPVWLTRRRLAYAAWARRHPEELAAFGNVAGRYRDNSELLFNLRALELFFPAHGHVYLVTDGQTPHWLRTSSRLTVVDHRALLPAIGPQVFDSGHIESYLHHIPGLSERFLYLNDDVFFGQPVDANWWFGERLKVFLEPACGPHPDALHPQATALVNASVQSRHWLAARHPGYRHIAQVYSHTPRAMRKSLMHALEGLAAEWFAQVRSTVFRSWRIPPIVSDLAPRWMVQAGHAEQQVLNPLTINTGDAQAAHQFNALMENFGKLPFFCINDTCDEALDDDPRLLRIAQTLQQLLPEPSSFEIVDKERIAA
ncbi:MAG: wcwK [Polaromonas sp.]|nr:wcwK [Polaromonas sp.]